MKIHDISMEIHPDMPVYKGREQVKTRFEVISDYSGGDVHETRLNMDMHSGTHVDAPYHMLENGDKSDFFDPESSLHSCRVLDLTSVQDRIEAKDLTGLNIEEGEFIIFKTPNSYREDFNHNFVYLAASGAEFLVDKGIDGVGIDSLGIETGQEGHPTHKNLLGAGILIVEGLRLAEVEAGEYTLLLAPLKIRGGDGIPARALLLDGKMLTDN